uniref:Uncharacterized protein n=1 Tax=Rhizophora mucronata TaxID=61149 RepID=A0A2P2PL35_RHIMU
MSSLYNTQIQSPSQFTSYYRIQKL